MSGKIISVYSSQGGTGKTTLATFIAQAFSLHTGKRTLLVDVDYPFSNDIYNFLKINENNYKRLSKFFTISPDAPMFKTISGYSYFHEKTGIFTLSLSENDKNFDKLTPSLLKTMIQKIRNSYDFIVFDIGMAINPVVETVLDLSGIILIPFINNFLSMNKLIDDLQYLRSKNFFHQKIEIVENMCKTDSLKKKTTPKKISDVINNRSIFAKIPYVESFLSKISEVDSYFTHFPNDPLSKSFDSLFSQITNHDTFKKSCHVEEEENSFDSYEFKLSIIKEVQDALKDIDEEIGEHDFDEMAKIEISRIIDERSSIKSREIRERLVIELFQETLKLGPIEDLLADPAVSEIMVNSFDKIYVEKNGIIELSDKKFMTEAFLKKAIDTIVEKVNRNINTNSPMVDARLEKDGSRVNAVIKPISVKGPVLTIRKFTKDYVGIQSLIKNNTMNVQIAEFLEAAVKAKMNILISGSTGSGKTTLLNILSEFISTKERIITIEDSAELKLNHPHVVTLESKPSTPDDKNEITIRDLVKNSLRMRPDRIIVGECRSDEALDMLQAMGTGHSGSMTSIHANNARNALSRVETLVMLVGSELSSKAIKEQIVAAIDIVVQIKRFKDGSRKIDQVTEVTGMEGDIITTDDIFVYKQSGEKWGKIEGDFIASGYPPKCWYIFKEKGIKIDKEIFWKT